ncbi:MAG: hypothetical protein HY040_06115 [Planctomycetes bacterium]|nr:hypothetical protein [Planctomycetota bacterium]
MREEILDIGTTGSTSTYPVSFGATGSWGMLVQHAAVSNQVLILKGNSAPWVLEAAKKLEELGKLHRGWDSYDGLPLDSSARRLTVNALGWLGNDNLPVPSVVLCSGGTVQLEWRTKGRELEIELGKDEAIEFAKIYPSGDIEEGEQKSNLPQEIHRLTWWLLHG